MNSSQRADTNVVTDKKKTAAPPSEAQLTVTVSGAAGHGKTALLQFLCRELNQLGVEVFAAEPLVEEFERRSQLTWPVPHALLAELARDRKLTVHLVEEQRAPEGSNPTRLFLSLDLGTGVDGREQAILTVDAAVLDKPYTCPADLQSATDLGVALASKHPHVFVQRSSSCDFPEELGLEEGLDLAQAFCEGYLAAKGYIGL
jgi:hypothetical protein